MKAQTNLIHFDRIIIGCFLALLGFGLVFVTSASMMVAQKHTGNSWHFFERQSIYAIMGLVAVVVALFIPTERWQRFEAGWLWLGVALLLIVLVPGIGRAINGSRRWITLGPIAIQVSEVVKLCAILYVSDYCVRNSKAIQYSFQTIVKPLLLLGIMAVLLLMEPDFGATVVIFVTVLGILCMAGVPIRWFLLLIALAGIAGLALIFISPYRLARLTTFLNPWANQYGSGYQLTQSLIAFGRGGIGGAGLGNSIQKLFYLPEAHTDFIFAIIAEELGLFGTLCLIGIYSALIGRGLWVAQKAQKIGRDFDAYLAYGISFWLGLQMIVNMGVNMGILPTKGLTLPFISYGGSSLLVDSFVIGLLLRIDYQNKQRSHETPPSHPKPWTSPKIRLKSRPTCNNANNRGAFIA